MAGNEGQQIENVKTLSLFLKIIQSAYCRLDKVT